MSPEFFGRLRAALVADCRQAIARHRTGPDTSAVYAFVVYYHPLFGDVGWMLHTESTAQPDDTPGFAEAPNHPDGVRFDSGSRDAFDVPMSDTTADLLQAYRDEMAESDCEDSACDSFVGTLVEAIKELEAEFLALDPRQDFVAFAADVDGADPDVVRATVSADAIERVFGSL